MKETGVNEEFKRETDDVNVVKDGEVVSNIVKDEQEIGSNNDDDSSSQKSETISIEIWLWLVLIL